MNWDHADLITWPAKVIDEMLEIMDAQTAAREERLEQLVAQAAEKARRAAKNG